MPTKLFFAGAHLEDVFGGKGVIGPEAGGAGVEFGGGGGVGEGEGLEDFIEGVDELECGFGFCGGGFDEGFGFSERDDGGGREAGGEFDDALRVELHGEIGTKAGVFGVRGDQGALFLDGEAGRFDGGGGGGCERR